MKVITISPSENRSPGIYLEAVTGIQKATENNEEQSISESKPMKSQEDYAQSSLDDDEDITQATDNTAQIKMIMELQKSIKML